MPRNVNWIPRLRSQNTAAGTHAFDPSHRRIADRNLALTTESSDSAHAQPLATRLGLRARLKLETRELHAQAERSGIMNALLHGRIERNAYCALLRNLREIYAGLEMALEIHFNHPLLAPDADFGGGGGTFSMLGDFNIHVDPATLQVMPITDVTPNPLFGQLTNSFPQEGVLSQRTIRLRLRVTF